MDSRADIPTASRAEKGTNPHDLSALLSPGERVLHCERPVWWAHAMGGRGGWLLPAGVGMVAAGWISCHLLLADKSPNSTETTVLLLTFLAPGLILLSAFLFRVITALRIRHVITDRRALVISGKGRRARVVFQWGDEPLEELSVRKSGRWPPSLYLGTAVVKARHLMTNRPALYGVRYADRVAALICGQRYAPGRPATWMDEAPGPYGNLVPAVARDALPASLVPHLDDSEEVVWIGQPMPGPFGWRVLRVSWPFLAVWGVLTIPALVVETVKWVGYWFGHGDGGDMALTVGLAVLAPLPFLFAVDIMKWRSRRASSVVYAITRRRALMFVPFERTAHLSVRHIGPTTVRTVRVTGDSRCGNILFEGPNPSMADRATLDAGFIGIRNPMDVASILREQAWTADFEWR